MKLTEEQIKENLACYEQAMRTQSIEGLEVQETSGEFSTKTRGIFWFGLVYRRKPQPELIPYDAQTWPLDAGWVRIKRTDGIQCTPTRPLDITYEGIRVAMCSNMKVVDWGSLLGRYELTRDNGKTWEPCGRLSE